MTLLPLTASAWHGGDPEFGFATAALGFGSLATPVLAGLVRGPTAHRTATLLAALPLVAVWVAPTWLLGLVPLALFGAGATVVECETTRVLQGQAPARYRALALGVADTAMIAAALCGAAAAPWFTGAVGPVAVPALRPSSWPPPAGGACVAAPVQPPWNSSTAIRSGERRETGPPAVHKLPTRGPIGSYAVVRVPAG
ncbi:MAG: hypothetical protein HZY73_16375 [Micropruina sp.]|nr:MAG: hypothetical protein HZY73_16375 [Micropruina sp.]